MLEHVAYTKKELKYLKTKSVLFINVKDENGHSHLYNAPEFLHLNLLNFYNTYLKEKNKDYERVIVRKKSNYTFSLSVW